MPMTKRCDIWLDALHVFLTDYIYSHFYEVKIATHEVPDLFQMVIFEGADAVSVIHMSSLIVIWS